MERTEREIKKEIVLDQTMQAMRICKITEDTGNHTGNIRCSPCRRRYPLWNMYRCFHCGLYLCPKCAKEHFSENKITKSDALELWKKLPLDKKLEKYECGNKSILVHIQIINNFPNGKIDVYADTEEEAIRKAHLAWEGTNEHK